MPVPETAPPTTKPPVEPKQVTTQKTILNQVVPEEPSVPFGISAQNRDEDVITEPATEPEPKSLSAVIEPPLSTELLVTTAGEEPAIEHDQACKLKSPS